jgi:hypothetical protein
MDARDEARKLIQTRWNDLGSLGAQIDARWPGPGNPTLMCIFSGKARAWLRVTARGRIDLAINDERATPPDVATALDLIESAFRQARQSP